MCFLLTVHFDVFSELVLNFKSEVQYIILPITIHAKNASKAKIQLVKCKMMFLIWTFGYKIELFCWFKNNF